jgi:hypothetical protein
MMISAKKKKEDQQNNRGRGFKESDAQKPYFELGSYGGRLMNGPQKL